MRRLLLVVFVALFGLPLVAATPDFSVKPKVVVYPFIANASTIDREASSRLATIIATRMADSKLVGVTPPPPGTERKDYLTVARAQSCDYYVSGYISPLGNGVSVVEQVVSTATGIVVFSQTAQLDTYNDAAALGDDLALFVSRHANRGLAAIGTAPPAATPTPAPSSGPEANLGKLFGRRGSKKNAATPKPTAAPKTVQTAAPVAIVPATPAAAPTVVPPPARSVAVAPERTAASAAEGYAIVPIEGSADATLREYATQRLLARTNGERAASTSAACAGHTVRAILSGTLAVRADAQFGGGSATFDLIATDCSGKRLWQKSYSNDAGGTEGQQIATERAVDAAIGAYLNPPKGRRRA